MRDELLLDNLGFCRFHRAWAREMSPNIIESLYGMKEKLLHEVATTVNRINSRNSSNLWESERTIDYVYMFLRRKRDVEGEKRPELDDWIKQFETNKREAALAYWYEIHKGIMESLLEL